MWNKVEARSMEISIEDEGTRKKRKKVLKFPKKILKNLWIVGKEDPRRVIHALKVGVALTLVSLLYLMEPFFKGVGKNALWAVMTVVVVLEFSAGKVLQPYFAFFVCDLILIYRGRKRLIKKDIVFLL